MAATKKSLDFDKIIKIVLLAMIAACMIALVLSVKSSGSSSGMSAGGPPGMGGAPSGAASSSGAPSASGSSGAVPAEGQAGAPAGSGTASNANGAAGEKVQSPKGAQGGANGVAGAQASAQGGFGGSSTRTSAAITVEAVTLAPASINTSIRLNGDVTSKSQISVYPDTAGKLVRYVVGVGTEVKKGDVIAYVDPSKPGASYVSSPVRSSIDGTVISLTQDAGATVSTSSAIATVGALNALEIVTYVPEKYIAVVQPGLRAGIALAPYPDRSFPATVTQVSPVVDSTSRTIQIKLTVTGGDGALRPGMFAVITLVTKEASGAMVVPSSALKTYNNKDIVYVIDGEGKARRKEVTVGLTNDTSAQLLSGAGFGDRVVTSGSVTEGTTVRVASTAGGDE